MPGGKRPEEVIYEYLLSLEPDHEFWSGTAQRVGFTWDYCKEHGPESDDYSCEKDREKYKAWFVAHQPYFDSTKLMDFWVQDNPEVVKSFEEEFKKAHNHIAKRMMTIEIP